MKKPPNARKRLAITLITIGLVFIGLDINVLFDYIYGPINTNPENWDIPGLFFLVIIFFTSIALATFLPGLVIFRNSKSNNNPVIQRSNNKKDIRTFSIIIGAIALYYLIYALVFYFPLFLDSINKHFAGQSLLGFIPVSYLIYLILAAILVAVSIVIYKQIKKSKKPKK